MGICLIIIITLEIIYRGKGVSFGDFCFAHMLVIAYLIFVPFTDVIEKYLLEFDYINPFKMLMIEGIFGCIITSIYSYKEEPFAKIKNIYEEKNFKFILLINYMFFFLLRYKRMEKCLWRNNK